MTGWMRTMCGLGLVVILAGSVGCEDKKNMGDGQDGATAADRIAELEDMLAQAERDRAADQDRLLALQAELDRLKNEAASQPQAPSGWTSVPGGAMIAIEGTVLFDSGKAALKPSARSTLLSVVQAIRGQYANHDIYVFGHTDAEPIRKSSWKDNYELSCQRALAVLRFLHKEGVASDIAACGWGDDRPVGDNASSTGKQANRRVEIFALERK